MCDPKTQITASLQGPVHFYLESKYFQQLEVLQDDSMMTEVLAVLLVFLFPVFLASENVKSEHKPYRNIQKHTETTST